MVAVQQCYKQTLVSILYLCILMIGFAYPNNTRAQSEGESWQNTSNNPACEEVRGKDTVWCGSVTDAAGNGLAAQVTINGKAMQADEKGNFLVEVPVNKELRNVVNVELLGYAPVSYIHNGSVAIQGLDIQLKTAQRFEVDPNKLIEIEDERGTRISIPESGLVDADGKRAEKPLIGYVYTYDPSKEAIPGDMDGIDFEGNLAAMYSAGAFNITIVDEQGSLYYLAPGVEAEISIRIPEGMVEPPDTMTIWELDETTGKWIARSIAKRSEDRYIGRVNFLNEAGNIDKEIPEPACVRVEIDPEYIKKYGSVLIRVEIGSPPQIRYFTLNEVVNIITNLPANTDIKFFIPHRATTPFTTVNTGAPWGGRGNPPPPYDKCNGNLAIKPPPPTPTPTPRPTLPPTPSPTPTPMPITDVGDAPDSNNNFSVQMDAYPAITANFPTIFRSPFSVVSGSLHWNALGDSWLGRRVSSETEADLPLDQDWVTNLDPSVNLADQDGADDGVNIGMVTLPNCGMTTVNYEVSAIGVLGNRHYINIWFDFNKDGDWEDVYKCPGGLIVSEWAVQDQLISVVSGLNLLTTPSFVSDNPPTPTDPMWMRISLSERPAERDPLTGLADGRGPASGFIYGETEDYLLR